MKRELLGRHTHILVALALVVLTLVAFWPMLHLQFVGSDDEQYIVSNPRVQTGLNAESIRWAFRSTYASNWHPLTWISHMVDCRLFGLNPLGHHAVNLLLHTLNVLLLYSVLRRMTGSTWKSAFVAAVFAAHPTHVESVAWTAERKDVLSTLFWMLTMWAYTRYAERPGLGRYSLVALSMALGLMCKPTLVTLPIVLLLMDYWPLRRLSFGKECPPIARWRLVTEKLPLLALSLASSIVTYNAQRDAMVSAFGPLALTARLDNALLSYVAYIGKLFWPVNLAAFYPHPGLSIPMWRIAVSTLILAFITFIAFGPARSRPYLKVGWLWFLGTLIPMIGIIQVGKAAMADRYTYVPYIGLSIMVAWGLGDLLRGRRDDETAPSLAPIVCATVAIFAMIGGTWYQLRFWSNEFTLFSRAVEVTKNNDFSHIHVGLYLADHGKLDEAAQHYATALKINPYSDRAHNNLGNVYLRQGRLDAALREYQAALDLQPRSSVGHFNVGLVLEAKGFADQAASEYRKALEVQPDHTGARIYLCNILGRQGKMAEVVSYCEEEVKIFPDSAEAHQRLGLALSKAGKFSEAETHYRAAIRLRPRYPEAYYTLGNALARQGKADDAIAAYRSSLKLRPDFVDAHFNLGVLLDGRGDMRAAMDEYRAAIKLDPKRGEPHVNLAIDLYMNGKYAEAWKEVRLARRWGTAPNPDFVKALSAKMPKPAP